MPKRKLPPAIKAMFEEWGKDGGKAGTGDSKVRGDAEYYRKLALRRKRKGRKEK
jgi:hypothetical protein